MKSRIFIGVLVVAFATAGFFGWHHYFPPTDSAATEVVAENSGVTDNGEKASHVQLTPDKLKAAGIELADVERTQLRPENKVPGRLKYDDRRHVEVRSATGGIVTAVRVNPGDQVKAGDVLIELSSPEVGSARADVLQRAADLKLAVESRDWEKDICDGLAKLSQAIRDRKPVESIKQEFKNVTLGKNREQLLSAYSDLLLAESLVNATRDSVNSGVVPGRLIAERTNNRDNAEAVLLTALESLTYTTTVSRRHAEAAVEDAERRLRISRQSVLTLLGHSDADEQPTVSVPDVRVAEVNTADTKTAGIKSADLQNPESLSLVQLRAPFAGTIERRNFSPSERVAAGDGLLTLADTATLWVAADLREREWSALVLKPGDEILVEPATPGAKPLIARVHFVGREVDPMTNAIPLVAVIDNARGQLRPGMFVRVVVPLAESRDTLTVPESSVLEHDGHTFVFTPDGEDTFHRVDFIPGLRVAGKVEVVSGLNAEQRVVSHGGFYLKSEMLLEGEE